LIKIIDTKNNLNSYLSCLLIFNKIVCHIKNKKDLDTSKNWASIQGFWTLNDKHKKVEQITATSINAEENVDYGLLDFDGNGKYRSPEFVWDVAPTALTFLNSDKFAPQYENDIFVGDAKYGNLYHFKLNEQRTGLLLDGPLEDKVGSVEELQQQGVVFGHGFGVITDIEVGPDGYLYILSFGKEGNLYRIVPATVNSEEKEIAKGEKIS
jgi:aldose sugar dehydrogenase